MDEQNLRFTIPADLGAVGDGNRRLEGFLLDRRVDGDVVFAAVLALEEVATNAIKYSFPEGGQNEVLVEARLDPQALRLQVSDDGREFDPLQAPAASVDLPAEDRPIGGLGIHLLRSIADEIEYRRAEGRNVLTMVFSLDPLKRRFSCR